MPTDGPTWRACEPKAYFEMLGLLASCGGIISDSGGITKTSPYFGKRCLVPYPPVEWNEIIDAGYGRVGFDREWLRESPPPRDRDFYYFDRWSDAVEQAVLNLTPACGQ